MRQKSSRRSFDNLSPTEKEAIFQECETIGAMDGEPLNKKDLRLHKRAGLPVGRPRIGQGAARINISMERQLLKTADRYARKQGMTRARLIAESIKAYIKGAA